MGISRPCLPHFTPDFGLQLANDTFGSAYAPERELLLHCQAVQRKEWCGGCAVLTLGVLTGALLFAYACAYHWYVVHDNPLALREIPLPGLAWGKQPLQPAHAQVRQICI